MSRARRISLKDKKMSRREKEGGGLSLRCARLRVWRISSKG